MRTIVPNQDLITAAVLATRDRQGEACHQHRNNAGALQKLALRRNHMSRLKVIVYDAGNTWDREFIATGWACHLVSRLFLRG
jgi:hypothetical protein